MLYSLSALEMKLIASKRLFGYICIESQGALSLGRMSIPLRKFLNIKCPLGSAKNGKHASWIIHGLMKSCKKKKGLNKKAKRSGRQKSWTRTAP